MTLNPYAPIAQFYDLEYGELTDDIDFYANLARAGDGSVLDAGTGTGRIAFGLARLGFDVTGVDNCPELLAQALNRPPDAAVKTPLFLPADLRQLDLGRRFGIAVLGLNTFAHMLTGQDQERALLTLRQHLTPQGRLAITLENPYAWVTAMPQNEVVFGWTRPGPGAEERTTMSFATSLDLATQYRHLELWYDVAAADGRLRRHQGSFVLRWFYPTELALLLERCGFAVEQVFGSYDLDPFDGQSPLQIVIAKPQK
ncbi:MAG: class I SAM-dependent methyltransferase [Dehalococcoidia bacterium]|nr:class I SAM-dependent methyltransferase [Dehalococcoidia bacterium]